MKKLLMITCMMFGGAFAAHATGATKATEGSKKTATKTSAVVENKVAVIVEKRAKSLSDKMVQDLRLNKYQTRRLREINLDVVTQKMEVEREYAGNPALIAQKSKEVTAERDRLLENVLSTVQYNKYFGSRKAYNQVEQDFMASLNAQPSAGQDIATVTLTPQNSTASIN